MDDYIASLRASPSDIESISRPSVDDQSFSAALLRSLRDDDSKSVRDAIIQAGTTVSPLPAWSDVILQWTLNEESIESPRRQGITEFAGRALADGVFPPNDWLVPLDRDVRSSTAVLKDILSRWSQYNFDAFLATCIERFSLAEARMSISQLLVTIVVDTPYDTSDTGLTTLMGKIVASPFLDALIRSLLLDTGNNLFSLNLRLLLTLVPYAPLAITPKVPFMAIILGRAISWRDRPFVDNDAIAREGVTRTFPPAPELKWQVVSASSEFKLELPEHLKPRRISQLFLIAMYGAWPSNVIAFVRDPLPYIRGKNVPPVYAVDWEGVWQPGLLASRLEPMIRAFRLHPSLVVFTSTAELADEKRWDRIDGAEFIARSQALANAEQEETTAISFLDEDEGNFIEIGNQRSAPSGRLERENDLLRLEAKFTNRVRKQYLHHISRLHLTSLRLNNDEAEIHSFVNRLKAQTQQIAELTAQLSQARTDASQAQQKHVKWQGQLRDKVASFREEKATWQSEAARIRAELSEAHATVQAQRAELAEVKNERFKLQNQLTEVEPKIRHLSDYEARMKQLTESQRLWDQDVKRCKAAEEEMKAAQGRCYETEQKLRASRQEVSGQAEIISLLESKVSLTKNPPEPKDRTPSLQSAQDPLLYIRLLEEAKAKADRLERENLELRTKTSANSRLDGEIEGDRSFLWDSNL
ncbi:hypothetical protein IAT40_006986 [Kwoniella sp. CBS 6097]